MGGTQVTCVATPGRMITTVGPSTLWWRRFTVTTHRGASASPSAAAATPRGRARRRSRRHRPRNGLLPAKPASVLTPSNDWIDMKLKLNLELILIWFIFGQFRYRTATHGKQSTHLAHNVHNLHINSDVSSASSVLSAASTVAVFNTTSGGQCTGVEAAILDSRRLYPSSSSASLAAQVLSVPALVLCCVVCVLTARWRWSGPLFYRCHNGLCNSPYRR